MHIHLDAVGGVAGDMVVAALLDAFPEHEDAVRASVRAASREGVSCTVPAHNDGILQGRRFSVAGPRDDHGASHGTHRHASSGDGQADHGQGHEHGQEHEHGHRPWAEIRDGLARSALAPAVRAHALAIFEHLARAEARVHGIAVEAVAFHEVGAWDSIADIVAVSQLVAALEARSWSVSALPLGSGRVRTQHGFLPVPAPATAILLEGFATLDDGIPGERVTPTGAAILRHLCTTPRDPGPRVLGRTGIGFGARTLPGLSNCLRVLAFGPAPAEAPGHRALGVIEFEVDDQSAEDLAMGLERLRGHPDILDVVQMPVFGKKGRMMTYVRALARADALEAAAAACFRETTTIGLRHHVVSGAALARSLATVEVDGRPVRVKTVERPGGRTAKAEADDALAQEGHAARAALRREAERLALAAGRGATAEPDR
ncbi:Pyridinium-3,5-bisthiocarboxylic acid mononucleotide nickel insertion protein [Methylobacterium crusticola]|uniref:Pyridinium-3,5-bisthiocarboxylic acid mononucleotide nickel insertion protein n=1 Tax=Methylobacterium crusticola TaxID=1697972 RepID=A0ABQ4QX98_9HYPH|nr:LarC family nickel insertion protein [Methylobacterium crusticola]GJD49539.1 Pyridinium-3,5-bisthiocarboxylic acid mononucleotide nickel insertion protein [Methylobacterium crusticola]